MKYDRNQFSCVSASLQLKCDIHLIYFGHFGFIWQRRGDRKWKGNQRRYSKNPQHLGTNVPQTSQKLLFEESDHLSINPSRVIDQENNFSLFHLHSTAHFLNSPLFSYFKFPPQQILFWHFNLKEQVWYRC